MKETEITMRQSKERAKNKVKELKRNTRLCKELFPHHTKPPEMGELIFMVKEGLSIGCSKEQIKIAGHWWLWARSLFIKNTMTKEMEKIMRIIALDAVKSNRPIHFVSARSPELIHAQISNQGDPNLPRSRATLKEFSGIIQSSSIFLPTIGTVLLADVAIDNLKTIQKVCPDLEEITKANLIRLESIIGEEELPNIEIVRLSQLPHPSGKRIGHLVNPDGNVNVEIKFSPRAERKILTASKESFRSHQRMFGWSERQSREHNRNLAKTMALVGQAVKIMQPPAFLIHNEAFISRGALNNLLQPKSDPLPVICLASLIEKKRPNIEKGSFSAKMEIGHGQD